MRSWIWLLAIGCGGEKGDSGTSPKEAVARECGTAFQACGGDPTGTWQVAGICDPVIDTSRFDCPEAVYEITADRSSGSLTLAASGEYTRTYAIEADFRLNVPLSCMQGVDCASLVSFSDGLVAGCSASVDGCDCSGTYTDLDEATGTWVLDGDEVVTDGVGRTAFCIDGKVADTQNTAGVRIIWTR